MKQQKNIFSYPLVWAVRLLSYLPLPVLYLLADLIYFLIAYIFRYRSRVILTNLRNSFPEKPEKEIRQISLGFYRHLADVIVETIKLLTISDSEMRRRCGITEGGKAIINHYQTQGVSFIGMLGHLGNWEWVPACTTLNFSFDVIPAYRPMRDLVIDRLMLRIRGRYAHKMVSKHQVGRTVIAYRKSEKPFVMGLISDQTPQPKGAFWTTFLSQDTPVNAGPEKLARTFKMPVLFVALRKVKRGHYCMHVEKLTDAAVDMPEGLLTEMFMQRLEGEIKRSPEHWLWSHRRWKHTKGVNG